MTTDVDFEQFIKLMDAALASDDKNVRQALRKFMFVAAMVLGDDCEPGPFTKMMETMDAMQRRLATLENQQAMGQNWYGDSGAGTGTTYPYHVPTTTPGGSASPTGTPPVWTNTNATSTTTTASNTGKITISGATAATTGNITLNGTTTANSWPIISSGYSYSPNMGGTTNWINTDNPETGTDIKAGIIEALDRLANVA